MVSLLGDMNYDSNLESQDNVFGNSIKEDYDEMICKKYSYSVNNKGEEIEDSVLTDDKEEGKESDQASKAVDNNGFVYPEHPIRKKSTWYGESILDTSDGSYYTPKFKVTDITSDEVVIAVTGNVLFLKKDSENTGTTEGTLRINRKTGLVIESKIVRSLKIVEDETTSSAVVTMWIFNKRK